ncbi:MAG: AraC family transcriptional regulator [Microbacterium sp.]|nr:AraC family transcriptional regulator [Microbacterium sp.]
MGRAFGGTLNRSRRTAQLHVVRSGALSTRARTTGDAVETFVSGQAFFTAGSDPIAMIAHRTSDVLALAAPVELFDAQPPSTTAAPLRIESPLLMPTVDFVLSAIQVIELEGEDTRRHYLDKVLQKMFYGLIADSSDIVAAPPAMVSALPLARARALMVERIADPDLTADMIAREVSVSHRQLQRLFRARGTTVQGELRHLRVEQACMFLRNRRYDAVSVDVIARRVGLSGRSSLARAMSAEGIPSPLQVRRASGQHHS